jgi:hypothetical protein
MMENPHNIGQSAHLLFIAKNIERVGDHATNIAEMVYYAATGEHMATAPRPDPLNAMIQAPPAGRGRPRAGRARHLPFRPRAAMP